MFRNKRLENLAMVSSNCFLLFVWQSIFRIHVVLSRDPVVLIHNSLEKNPKVLILCGKKKAVPFFFPKVTYPQTHILKFIYFKNIYTGLVQQPTESNVSLQSKTVVIKKFQLILIFVGLQTLFCTLSQALHVCRRMLCKQRQCFCFPESQTQIVNQILY